MLYTTVSTWASHKLQALITFLTLSSRRSLSYRSQLLISYANQSTDFYMIGTSIMKELKTFRLPKALIFHGKSSQNLGPENEILSGKC